MKRLLPHSILILWLLINGILPAQSTFQKAMNGSGWDVQPTRTGGMILCGMASLSGATGNDLFLMRTNAQGDTAWSRAIGGGDFDTGVAGIEAADGGFIAVGYTYSQSAGASDGFAVKTDATGHLLWAKSYGGPFADDLVAVRLAPDGGYLMLGSSASFGLGNTDFDVFLVRTDGNGDTVWTRRYGTMGSDNGLDLVAVADGYLVTGYSNGFGVNQDEVFLMKVDTSGNLLWAKSYGGTDSETGNSLIATADGGYLLTGKTHSFGAFSNDGDLYLIKTDAQGNLKWSQAYGGPGTDWGQAVLQSADGGYVVTGHTMSFGAGQSDAYILSMDSLGNIRWSKTYGGPGFDYGYGLLAAPNGGWAIVGQTSSFQGNGFYHFLTDQTGESGCFAMVAATVQSPCATQVGNPVLIQSPTSPIVADATVEVTGGTFVDVLCSTVERPEPESFQVSLHPNPASGAATLTLENLQGHRPDIQIYDVQGRLVAFFNGIVVNQVTLPCDQWPRGLYCCRVSGRSGKTLVVKLLVE